MPHGCGHASPSKPSALNTSVLRLATLAALGLAAIAPQAAHAQAFNNKIGLTGPHNTVSLDNPPAAVADGARLTTQFASQGVTFSGGGALGLSGLFYDSSNATGAAGATGFSGAYAESINPNGNITNGPFTITFTGPVNAAALAVVDQDNIYTFDALLNGNVIDRITGLVPALPGAGFVGFRDETFDAIRVTRLPGGGDTAIAFDTIQFRAASTVPEPSSVAAFAFTGLGAAGLILKARKRVAA